MLQFTELNVAFPTWVHNSGSTSSSYSPVSELQHLSALSSIPENSKFRIMDGKLHIDKRKFQGIRRKMSGDSRWKVLKIIKELVDKYNIHGDILDIVKIMNTGTYKNDKKWKAALNEIIPERYFRYNLHFQSPMSSGQIRTEQPRLIVVSEGTGSASYLKKQDTQQGEIQKKEIKEPELPSYESVWLN